MDDYHWQNRVPDSIKKASDAADNALEAVLEVMIAADFYHRAAECDTTDRSDRLAKYGGRFLDWMYQLQERQWTLQAQLCDVGHEFATAAKGVQSIGRFSASSVHHLCHDIAFEIVTDVSSAVIHALLPSYFRPGVETFIPDLIARDDFKKALPEAVAACLAIAEELGQDDINRMSSMLDQELASFVPAEPKKGDPGYLGLIVDHDRRSVSRDGATADFAGNDVAWRIFLALYSRKDAYASQQDLLRAGWTEEEIIAPETVQRHISTIRKAIEPLPIRIRTVRNVGYRLEEKKS